MAGGPYPRAQNASETVSTKKKRNVKVNVAFNYNPSQYSNAGFIPEEGSEAAIRASKATTATTKNEMVDEAVSDYVEELF